MPGSIGPTVCAAMSMLAEYSRRPPTVDIMFWLGVLLFVCVIGFVFVTWLKKRIDGDETEVSGSVMESFGLSDLRRLHQAGELSDEEFERARHKMLIAAGAIEPDPPEEDEHADVPADDPTPATATPPAAAPETTDQADDDLGPELLLDTDNPEADDPDSRKRDCDAESEDDSKPGID